MLLDRQNLCSVAQAVTTGNQVSTDAVDLWQGRTSLPTLPSTSGPPGTIGSPISNVGMGYSIQAWAQVVTTFTGGTSLQVQILEADAADLTTGQVILVQTIAILEAVLVAGYQFRLGTVPYVAKRFLGFRYVTVGTHGAGNITAGFVLDVQTNMAGI